MSMVLFLICFILLLKRAVHCSSAIPLDIKKNIKRANEYLSTEGVLNSLAVKFTRIGSDWIGADANYRLTFVDGRHHVTQGRICLIHRIHCFRHHIKTKLT